MGSPPYFRISSAISGARRLSKLTTRSPLSPCGIAPSLILLQSLWAARTVRANGFAADIRARTNEGEDLVTQPRLTDIMASVKLHRAPASRCVARAAGLSTLVELLPAPAPS